MSDHSKQFESTSALTTSKRPPTRPLGRFTIPNTESGGSNQPKSVTAKRIEAERDRPRNLFPTSHKTHVAKFTPDADDPRDILRRSTERNTAPSPFTFEAPFTSRCVNNTAGVANGPQAFQYHPCIEHIQHKCPKNTLEYQPTRLGDRKAPHSDDATTFLHPSQPQIVVGLSGESHMEARTSFESLLTAAATARRKWLLLCIGVMSLLFRVQPLQRHRTDLIRLTTDGTSSCTIKFWLSVPLAHLR